MSTTSLECSSVLVNRLPSPVTVAPDCATIFDVDICTLHHIGIRDEFRDPVFDLFDASNSTIRGSLYAYGNVSCTHLFDDTLLGGAIKFEPIR